MRCKEPGRQSVLLRVLRPAGSSFTFAKRFAAQAPSLWEARLGPMAVVEVNRGEGAAPTGRRSHNALRRLSGRIHCLLPLGGF
jgi:hypothetical protein